MVQLASLRQAFPARPPANSASLRERRGPGQRGTAYATSWNGRFKTRFDEKCVVTRYSGAVGQERGAPGSIVAKAKPMKCTGRDDITITVLTTVTEDPTFIIGDVSNATRGGALS